MGRLTMADIESIKNTLEKLRTENMNVYGRISLIDDENIYEAINAVEKLAHYEDMEEQGRLVEQKHGKWEPLDSYVYECECMWQCSECGEDFYFEFGTPLECRAYYCPNCGAKMDEVE